VTNEQDTGYASYRVRVFGFVFTVSGETTTEKGAFQSGHHAVSRTPFSGQPL